MHNLKRPLLAVLPAPSLPMICLIFGLLGRVSARAQPPPVPMEQQKHLESPPTPMNPVNPVQQQITGMTTPANPLVSTATEPPPPPTSADNTTHPCRNPNIAACFHLIALQMNKTEELLQMANQTLSTASQAHDGSLAASVTSGVGNDTTVAPAVAQNSPSSPLVTSSPTAVAAPNSEMATHVENGASMPISARVTGHSKKELEEKKHRHKRSVEHKKKRFRVKHLKKKQGLPGKKTKRRRKGKKMKLKADRVKAVAAKSDGHHSSLMNEEVTAKSDDETDKKKLSEKSDKKVKKKHHKKNKEKHEMANEQEDGSGTAKNELAEKESWSKKESKKPSKSNEEEESSVEEKDAFLEDQLTSIEDISSAERVVIKKEESNLIKDIPYSDRVTLGDSQERLRIPQKHMLRFKRQAAVTQQTPASLASVQPPAPAQPSLESSANNTLFNNSVVGFEAKLEQELAAAPKGLILIVKEPGESNLIAGEQVDGNLNPIGANGTNTATNGTVNLMTPKIGLMNNKMGNMSEPSPPASNATLAPTSAPLVNGNLTQQPAAPVNGTAPIVAPLAPINVTLAPGAAVAPTNVLAVGGEVLPAPGAVPPAPVLPGSPGLTVTTLSPPVTGAAILNATVQTVAASIAPTPAPAINST